MRGNRKTREGSRNKDRNHNDGGKNGPGASSRKGRGPAEKVCSNANNVSSNPASAVLASHAKIAPSQMAAITAVYATEGTQKNSQKTTTTSDCSSPQDDIKDAEIVTKAPLASKEEHAKMVVVDILNDCSTDDILLQAEKLEAHPLLLAAGTGHLEGLRKLVVANLNINMKHPKTGDTATHLAASGCHLEALRLLMCAKPNLNALNDDGNNAFMAGVKTGKSEPVNYLWRWRQMFKINQANKKGLTALHLAAEKSWEGCVRTLLHEGCARNWTTREGNTAMAISAQNGDLAIVKLLVNNGACITIENQEDCTPICLAVQEGHRSVYTFLLNQLSTHDREEYVKRRVDFLHILPPGEDTEEFLETVLYPVLHVLARHKTTRDLVHRYGVLPRWLASLKRHLENEHAADVGLHCLAYSMWDTENNTVNALFVEGFRRCNGPDFVMYLLQYYKNANSPFMTTSSVLLLLPFCETPSGKRWLERNYHNVCESLQTFEKEKKGIDFIESRMKDSFMKLWKKFKEKFHTIQSIESQRHGAELLESEEREKMKREKKREKRRQKRQLQRLKEAQLTAQFTAESEYQCPQPEDLVDTDAGSECFHAIGSAPGKIQQSASWTDVATDLDSKATVVEDESKVVTTDQSCEKGTQFGFAYCPDPAVRLQPFQEVFSKKKAKEIKKQQSSDTPQPTTKKEAQSLAIAVQVKSKSPPKKLTENKYTKVDKGLGKSEFSEKEPSLGDACERPNHWVDVSEKTQTLHLASPAVPVWQVSSPADIANVSNKSVESKETTKVAATAQDGEELCELHQDQTASVDRKEPLYQEEIMPDKHTARKVESFTLDSRIAKIAAETVSSSLRTATENLNKASLVERKIEDKQARFKKPNPAAIRTNPNRKSKSARRKSLEVTLEHFLKDDTLVKGSRKSAKKQRERSAVEEFGSQPQSTLTPAQTLRESCLEKTPRGEVVENRTTSQSNEFPPWLVCNYSDRHSPFGTPQDLNEDCNHPGCDTKISPSANSSQSPGTDSNKTTKDDASLSLFSVQADNSAFPDSSLFHQKGSGDAVDMKVADQFSRMSVQSPCDLNPVHPQMLLQNNKAACREKRSDNVASPTEASLQACEKSSRHTGIYETTSELINLVNYKPPTSPEEEFADFTHDPDPLFPDDPRYYKWIRKAWFGKGLLDPRDIFQDDLWRKVGPVADKLRLSPAKKSDARQGSPLENFPLVQPLLGSGVTGEEDDDGNFSDNSLGYWLPSDLGLDDSPKKTDEDPSQETSTETDSEKSEKKKEAESTPADSSILNAQITNNSVTVSQNCSLQDELFRDQRKLPKEAFPPTPAKTDKSSPRHTSSTENIENHTNEKFQYPRIELNLKTPPRLITNSGHTSVSAAEDLTGTQPAFRLLMPPVDQQQDATIGKPHGSVENESERPEAKVKAFSSAPIPCWVPPWSTWRELMNNLLRLPECYKERFGRLTLPKHCNNFTIAQRSLFSLVSLGILDGQHEVAVKRIQKQELQMCKPVLDSLLRKKFSHPNILPYLCHTQNEFFGYIVTELCEMNLAAHVHTLRTLRGCVGGQTGTHLCLQIIEGLNFLHQHKTVHGRLKLQNVLVDALGRLRLADYGLPRGNVYYPYAFEEGIAHAKCWRPTPVTASDQDISSFSCQCKADIQVAGMLLYYVMTGGDHAFGSTAEEVETNVLTGHSQMKLISPEADDLFDRMLATPASKRPSAESILSHPFFWDDREKAAVLSAACREMGRQINSSSIPTIWTRLAVIRSVVISNWRKAIDHNLLKELEDFRGKKAYSNNLPDLLVCMDHARVCRPVLSHGVQHLLGEHCSYFLTTFPWMFMAVYRILQSIADLKIKIVLG